MLVSLCGGPLVQLTMWCPQPESSLTEAYEKWREWADMARAAATTPYMWTSPTGTTAKQEVQGLIKDKGECGHTLLLSPMSVFLML